MAKQAAKESNSLNLYQRISAVMADVRYLKKDKAVSTGGSGSYQAMSEEKVTETVRQSLITHGLVILPVRQQHRLDDLNRGSGKIVSLTTVDVEYKIVNIDNPEEWETLASSGTGVDNQDKGVGKAMTYAYKYVLLRTFGIATGNDTDDVSNEELDRQQRQAADNEIAQAVSEMKAVASREESTVVWAKYPHLQDSMIFKSAAQEAGKRFPKTQPTVEDDALRTQYEAQGKGNN